MRGLWKYLFGLLVLGVVVVFYFLKTDLGYQNLKYFIGNYLSKETFNKIEVRSISFKKYPYLTMELQVNETATVTLKGEISKYDINMYYHLKGETFRFNNFSLDNRVDVQGKLIGPFSSLLVRGYGDVFNGKVKYNFINTPKKIKTMNIEMTKVESEKVLNFLEQKPLVKGILDLDAQFNIFSTYEKEGRTKIYMDKASIPEVSNKVFFVLNSLIEFEDMDYRYEGNLSSTIGDLSIENGHYYRSKKIANAQYTIEVKDLSFFEKSLKNRYQDVLKLNGTLFYDYYSGLFILKGRTSQFGGELSYIYKKNSIDVKFNAVSLEALLKSFSYPVFFTSKIDGTMNLSLEEKILLINTELHETHFKRSEFTDMIYNKLKIDILKGNYNQSFFLAGYKNHLLSSTLKIDNGINHLYLIDSKLNILNNIIDTKFDIKLEKKEFYGKIQGTLENPKVWIDKSKLFTHETRNKLNSWLRKRE